MVGHLAIKAQPTEPAVGEVEVNLLAQPPLGPDPEAVADQQHPDQKLGIDRWPASRTVERRQPRPELAQIDEEVDPPQQMVNRHMALEGELVEQRSLFSPSLAHHQSSSRFDRASESTPPPCINRVFQQNRPKADIGTV